MIMRIALTILALGLASVAQAQDYPSRPITLLVPAAPGGGNDVVARVIADKLGQLLGQPVIVENRGGAGGTFAARQVAKSAPDGYTIGLGNPATLAIAPTTLPNVGYDPRTDFAPVGLIASSPHLVMVYPGLPAHTLKELIALAKADPGSLTFASGGAGSPTHLGPELLAVMAGIKIRHVPYKGTGPALADLVGGHVQIAFSSVPAALGLVRDGQVRALAITSATRSSLFPDVPTVAEAGVPGYESAQRYGIIAPAHTPRPIIDKLNAALREALASPEVKARLAAEGAEPLTSSPEEYAADIDREETKWSKIIKQLAAKPE